MLTGHEDVSEEMCASTDGSKLLEEFGSLCLSQKLYDVTFLVGKEKLHAHKAILAVRNKYFETLFNANSEKKEIPIPNTSPEAFRLLLKYIYTDTIAMPTRIELSLEVLILAQQYSAKHLTSVLVRKINAILDVENVFFFLNGSNDEDLPELRDACHLFMDANAMQILASDSFNDLTQKSVIQALKRDTFLAPEMEIFKRVAKWCERNQANIVLECVRLSVLTVSEILSIVWPTKLVGAKKLLEILSEIVGTDSKKLLPRATLSVDENIATVQHGTEVFSELDTSELLIGNTNVNNSVQRTIDGQHGIIVCLGRSYCINHIRMMLYDADERYFTYYIETSLDRKKWQRVIDYSKYSCRSVQNLYFDQRVSQYLKIVGTSNTKGKDFHLVFFEAFYKSKVPKTINAIICPERNVATPENKAKLLAGNNRDHLLNGKYQDYSYHPLSDSTGIIVQLAQPYMISSMQLLLYEPNNRSYRYFIETSVNKTDWEIAVDKRTEEFSKSWQDIQFAERPVVFIKICGTYSSASTVAILNVLLKAKNDETTHPKMHPNSGNLLFKCQVL